MLLACLLIVMLVGRSAAIVGLCDDVMIPRLKGGSLFKSFDWKLAFYGIIFIDEEEEEGVMIHT